jgi:hypothetical protein
MRNIHEYTQFGDVYVKVDQLYQNQRPGANGCIEWTGAKHPQGYGMIGGIRASTQRRIMMTVHRVLMRIKLGRELTVKEFVIHTCSNTGCCNSDHLILGNARIRNHVMIANGRRRLNPRPRRGPPRKQNRVYKYTDEEILWLRTADLQDIATKYNVTRSRASQLRWIAGKYRWI